MTLRPKRSWIYTTLYTRKGNQGLTESEVYLVIICRHRKPSTSTSTPQSRFFSNWRFFSAPKGYRRRHPRIGISLAR
ncbi:hypothetical protein VTN00DRAFT_1899 [Thermoascus crustaceus]|uniref:uncharacterized protein n=1 Tax=Thermoascus crustaceus TaxID=5088 RepID=UPI0037443966